MDFESEDILGTGKLSLPPPTPRSWLLSFSLLSLAGVFTYIAGGVLWAKYIKARDLAHKKALRRQHGIPDTDLRPFAVAFSAVERARKEHEREKAPPAPPLEQPQLRSRFNDVEEIRASAPSWASSAVQHHAPILSRQHSFINQNIYPQVEQTRYMSPAPQITIMNPAPQVSGSQRYRSPSQRKSLNLTPAPPGAFSNKRVHEDDEEVEDGEPIKKSSRVEGGVLHDAHDPAPWLYSNTNKRRAFDEGEDAEGGGKRFRGDHLDSDPDVEMGDEVPPLTRSGGEGRGRKRDRAEAGSTFGGEDLEDPEGKDKRVKKKTKKGRKSEVLQPPSRGLKRDREEEELPFEGGKKRGKRYSNVPSDEDEGYQGSDVSMEGSSATIHTEVSTDPMCKGRRVGDEWEVSGVRYKVAPGGERLRLALVKRPRNKYAMPEDSIHPDRDFSIQAFVETWLTEAQYAEAKDRQELAWQDVGLPQPHKSSPPPPSPEKGKNLLWSSDSPAPISMSRSTSGSTTSATSGTHTPSKRGPYRQSVATNLGLRVNPFSLPSPLPSPAPSLSSSSRRISSVGLEFPSTGGGGSKVGVASPGQRGVVRSFSKWEKQDLEAEAFRKMRAKQDSGNATTATTTNGTASTNLDKAKPLAGEKTVLSIPSVVVTPASFVDDKEKEKAGLPSKPVDPAPVGGALLSPPKLSFSAPKAPTGVFAPPAPPAQSAPAPALALAPAAPVPAKETAPAQGIQPGGFFTSTTVTPPSTTTRPAPVRKPGMFDPKPALPAPTPVQPPVTTTPTFNFAVPSTGTSSFAFGPKSAEPVKPTSAFALPPSGGSSFNFAPAKTGSTTEQTVTKPTSAFAQAPAGASAFTFGPTKTGAEQPKAPPALSTPLFSFPRSGAPSPSPLAGTTAQGQTQGSVFGPSADAGASTPALTGANPAAPKFSFGFGGKPSTDGEQEKAKVVVPTPAATPAAEAASQPKFTFGGPVPTTETTSVFGGGAAASPFGTQNKESFATTTSIFGAKENGGSAFGGFGSAAKPAEVKPSATSAFGAFGGNSTAKPAETKPATTSAFGGFGGSGFGSTTPTTNNAFSTTTPTSTPPAPSSNIFGSSSAPSFSFGQTNTPTTTPAAAENNKPAAVTFAFGAPATATTTPTTTTETPKFNFGATSKPFGAPSAAANTGLFGGFGTGSTATTKFSFGQK